MPLAQCNSGNPDETWPRSFSRTPRKNWAGTTSNAASAAATAAPISLVHLIAGSSLTPGR